MTTRSVTVAGKRTFPPPLGPQLSQLTYQRISTLMLLTELGAAAATVERRREAHGQQPTCNFVPATTGSGCRHGCRWDRRDGNREMAGTARRCGLQRPLTPRCIRPRRRPCVLGRPGDDRCGVVRRTMSLRPGWLRPTVLMRSVVAAGLGIGPSSAPIPSHSPGCASLGGRRGLAVWGGGVTVTNTPSTEASTVHGNWRLCVVGADPVATISNCRRRGAWFKADEEQTPSITGTTRIRFLAVADRALAADVLMFGTWSALTTSGISGLHANPGGARVAVNRRPSWSARRIGDGKPGIYIPYLPVEASAWPRHFAAARGVAPASTAKRERGGADAVALRDLAALIDETIPGR